MRRGLAAIASTIRSDEPGDSTIAGGMWSRLDLRGVGQRPLDDVRITLEHRKKDHRRTIRPAPALLPVAQSADRNANPSRECVLRQAGSGPDGHHIDALPHMDFRSCTGLSARI